MLKVKRGAKYCLYLISALAGLVFLSGVRQAPSEIIHEVTIHHPGMKEDKHCKLIQREGPVDDSLAFRMSVQSVICLDGQCKIVDVNLHWDRTGAYQSYSLPEGVTLEKKDGVLFTEADYRKLQNILKDETSLFAEFQLAEVVDVNKDDGGIDGISGATVLTDETATVKGATWTCYTLWHWANGDVRDIIRGITLRSADKTAIEEMLASGNQSLRLLALQLFGKRGWYDEKSVTQIVARFPDYDRAETKLAIDYLVGAPSEIYEREFYPLFDSAHRGQRVMILDVLTTTSTMSGDPSPLRCLSRIRTYQEANLLINYFSNREIPSPEVIQALIPYLEHENFLIARRVYWYLNLRSLTEQQRAWVNAFGDRNADRL